MAEDHVARLDAQGVDNLGHRSQTGAPPRAAIARDPSHNLTSALPLRAAVRALRDWADSVDRPVQRGQHRFIVIGSPVAVARLAQQKLRETPCDALEGRDPVVTVEVVAVGGIHIRAQPRPG